MTEQDCLHGALHRVAAKIAKAQAAWLDDSFEATLADYVRQRVDANWAVQRQELEHAPVIPRFWEAETR